MTPTKILGLSLFFAGAAVLVFGRVVTDIDGGVVTGAGLALIGVSFLVDALLPGGSELSDEQEVLMKHAGLPHGSRAVKGFGLLVGIPLTLAGLYLALG